MDQQLQAALNGLAGHSAVLDALMRFGAANLIFFVPVLLLGLWFWPAASEERALNQRIAVLAATGAALALACSLVVGQIHYEARPFVTDPATRLLVQHSPDNGFPSDHAAIAFAAAGGLWRRPAMLAMSLLFAICIAIARVFVGVHWPVDVLAGAIVGALAGGTVAFFCPDLKPIQTWCSRSLPAWLVAAP